MIFKEINKTSNDKKRSLKQLGFSPRGTLLPRRRTGDEVNTCNANVFLNYFKLIAILFFIVITSISCGNNNENNKNNKNNITPSNPTPVNISAKQMIAELVFENEKEIDLNKIKSIIKADSIQTDSIYQWQNHIVIFDKISDTNELKNLIKKTFPTIQLNIYANPFYEFSRILCNNSNMAKKWDNIILTANLVADTFMQNQYLNYHKTQFEKWPEVSKGFCNASFQQLLVYKNGRQLMLVISIPKGESLDKLNPKTEENNPRVKYWNKLMSKYQEGIAGTKKGETWVFLKPVVEK